jgi:hypothetical protein
MAISPQDVALSSEELTSVEEIERAIDAYLHKNYVQGSSISPRLDSKLSNKVTASQRVRNELLRRYKAAGWEVNSMFGVDRWTFSIK